MAACPECGSSHIALSVESGVNWGRALGGWLLFGPIGGAVGSVTGERNHANQCLDCGTIWKAAELYQTLSLLKSQLGRPLDLASDDDRLMLRAFLADVSPIAQAGIEAEKRSAELRKKSDSLIRKAEDLAKSSVSSPIDQSEKAVLKLAAGKTDNGAFLKGCLISPIIAIIGTVFAALMGFPALFAFFILLCLPPAIGSSIDSRKNRSMPEFLRRRQKQKAVIEAKEQLRAYEANRLSIKQSKIDRAAGMRVEAGKYEVEAMGIQKSAQLQYSEALETFLKKYR